MAVFNTEEYLKESIESILNQTLDFEKNVQLILVDDESTDSSLKIAESYHEKYPENIMVLTKKNGGASSARNFGLNHIHGKYVNFLDSDDLFSPDVLEKVLNFFKKHESEIDFATVNIERFGAVEGGHPLDYKFKGESRVVNLLKDYEYIQLHGGPSFFKKSVFDELRFDESLVRSEDAFLINYLLLNNPKYGIITDCDYYYRKRFSYSSVSNSAFRKKEFFNEYLKNFYLKLIESSQNQHGEVLKFIQYLIVYDLKVLFRLPEIPDILSKQEIDEFWKLFNEVLSYVDDDIIYNHLKLNHNERSFIFYIKNNDFHVVARPNKQKVFLKSGDNILSKLHNHKIRFDSIDYIDNNLCIEGYYVSNCISDVLTLIGIVKIQDGELYTVEAETIDKSLNSEENRKYLGVDWLIYYSFRLKIPIEKNNNYKIKFKLKYSENGKTVNMFTPMMFNESFQLSEENYFFSKSSRVILYKDDAFHVIKKTLKFYSKLRFNSFKEKFN